MSEPAGLTEVADGVMTITINRPQAKNAVNKDVAACGAREKSRAETPQQDLTDDSKITSQ